MPAKPPDRELEKPTVASLQKIGGRDLAGQRSSFFFLKKGGEDQKIGPAGTAKAEGFFFFLARRAAKKDGAKVRGGKMDLFSLKRQSTVSWTRGNDPYHFVRLVAQPGFRRVPRRCLFAWTSEGRRAKGHAARFM